MFVMSFVICLVLFILCVKFINGDNIFNYPNCNGTSKYQKSPNCIICQTPEECQFPKRREVCTSALVEETLANLAKVFKNPKPLTDQLQHGRAVCFGFQAKDLNGKEYDIRGCMYFQLPKQNFPIMQYTFDFLPLYSKRTYLYNVTEMRTFTDWGFLRTTQKDFPETVKVMSKNFETYDRHYWKSTHFPFISCLQCEGEVCNEKISPYEGGKILFQRPYRSLKQWNCIVYTESNKDQFKKQCKRDKTVCEYDNLKVLTFETHLKCGDEWTWPDPLWAKPMGYRPGWYRAK